MLVFLQLFELGPDGGDHETDGDLLAETDVLAYDCAARYSKLCLGFFSPHNKYTIIESLKSMGFY